MWQSILRGLMKQGGQQQPQGGQQPQQDFSQQQSPWAPFSFQHQPFSFQQQGQEQVESKWMPLMFQKYFGGR